MHILIISATDKLADQTVSMIRRRIEFDQRYKAVFGDLKPKNPQLWTDNSFIVTRKKISKFPTLSSAGMGSSGQITGQGFDLIVCDDIISKDNVMTEYQREKSRDWFFEVVQTTLFSTGATLVVGSRWHHDDLYNDLITERPKGFGWPNQTLKSVLNEAEILQGAKPKVLWPQVWSYERLMQKKEDLGTIIFNCQYLNQPTALQGDVLKADWLHSWNEADNSFYPSPNLPVYAGIDPSLGENDFFAIASLAVDRPNNRGYLLDVWCEHMSFGEILNQKLPELFSRYKYRKMYLETNFWQKLLLKYPEMQTHKPTGEAYPIVPIKTMQSKEARFIPLSSHFESRRVIVNPQLLTKNSEFLRQWVEFPRGEHDDAVDCVEMAVANAFASDWELPDAQVGGAKFSRDFGN